MKHSENWFNFRRDRETGIETVNAHFNGHAYDAHDHEELLLGVTLQGAQRFSCHRKVHTSTPGKAILIEPGTIHDGYAAENTGFTYAMLYIPQTWIAESLLRRGYKGISMIEGAFRSTLSEDLMLRQAIYSAACAFQNNEGKLARDESMDMLVDTLLPHVENKPVSLLITPPVNVSRVRDYLHDNMSANTGLDELAILSGTDRFRMTRQFKAAFGQSPHAYLVRLRLRTARRLLAQGLSPSQAASQTGFADQSHFGRWFRRAYGVSPAAWQNLSTNVLD
ncbi:MAG: AraC family transcriptional regulator [Klebsiella michiganensis]|nr:AraC family transcriptional regulator [Klebsiella michiganensis]